MIEVENGRLIVSGQKLPKGDIQILQVMIRENRPITTFDIMKLVGKIYPQYIQARMRILDEVLGLIVKPERGKFEINPVIREELKSALEKLV